MFDLFCREERSNRPFFLYIFGIEISDLTQWYVSEGIDLFIRLGDRF